MVATAAVAFNVLIIYILFLCIFALRMGFRSWTRCSLIYRAHWLFTYYFIFFSFLFRLNAVALHIDQHMTATQRNGKVFSNVRQTLRGKQKKINWKIYIRNFQLTLYPLLISILMISAEWLMKNFFFSFLILFHFGCCRRRRWKITD